MFSDIKFFIKKFIKNPALVTAAAFLLYRFITKNKKKENITESITKLESITLVDEKDSRTLLYDDKQNKYLVVDAVTHEVWSSKDKDALTRFLQK